eukprot:351544_1
MFTMRPTEETVAISTNNSNDDFSPNEPGNVEGVQEQEVQHIKNHLYLFLVYCLFMICCGLLEPLPGSLFIELEKQLDVGTSDITPSLIARSISFGIGSIITGLVVDKFTESHRYCALLTILCGIFHAILPYTKSLLIVYITFILNGYVLSIAGVTFPIYLFRLYPKKGDRVIYIAMSLLGLSKAVIPFGISLSISMTDSYAIPLISICVLLIIFSILILLFATPKHDESRNINQTNSKNIDSKSILDLFHENKSYIYYQRALIFVLSCLMMIFSASQECFISFVAVYCEDYVRIDNTNIARYLISIYYIGQLLYRFIISLLPFAKQFEPSKVTIISFTALVVLTIILIIFDTQIVALFIIWFLSGFFGSSVFPEIYKWCERVKPVSGLFSLIFIGQNAFGEVIAVLLCKELIQLFGAEAIKYPTFSFNAIGLIINVIMIVIYLKYIKLKAQIINYETV